MSRANARAGHATAAGLRARLRPFGGRQLGVSVIVIAVLLGAGVLASVLAARGVARSDATKARLSFKLASEEIASTLKLAIQQEEGLVISASAYVAGNPRTTPRQFDKWAAAVRALERYPELQDIGLLALVPARSLDSFRTRMLADPILPASRQPLGSRGSFRVEPQGNRPYYCLAAAGVVRSQVAILPPGLDYCAVQPALLGARDSGQSSYVPFLEGNTTTLAVQTPVYSGGTVPATVPERRRAFLGWLGESLVPNVVLREALQAHPRVAVSFRYHAGFSDATFHSGAAPRAAQSATIDLHNGWTVQSLGAAAGTSVFANRNALAMLVGGIALTLLVVLLVLVLATGRIRALSLVREKTKQLSYQALHDNLTGLPNRALVIERAEHMLAQACIDAAFFVDVDSFKQINDQFGHAAGDEVLKAVAGRLVGAVRENDVVGRLGGDEFVVLLDSSTGELRPDAVAERLVMVLHHPMVLRSGTEVSVSASVGIAMGSRSTVDQLLRDADLALYAAKAAGKDRYMLYEAGMEGTSADAGTPRVRIAEAAPSDLAVPHGERRRTRA